MSAIISYCILICWQTLVFVLAATVPDVLSDSNSFLESFVGSEALNILGVILAITVASAGQLHLELNKIEERYDSKNNFVKTRSGIRSAVYALIILFFTALALTTVKPLVGGQKLWVQSIFNGSIISILIWNALILTSITQAIFRIQPK